MKFFKNFIYKTKYKMLQELYYFINRLVFYWFLPNRKLTFNKTRTKENAEKYGYLNCQIGKQMIKVPIQNEFGKNYPVYATDIVHKLFDIKDDEIVVDVGGGNNPLKRANIVVDLYPEKTSHRGEPLKLYPQQKFVLGDVQNLYMFKDKEIDFLFTMQTLEHVDDPERACAEIIRVAKRGFIDVPRSLCDIHIGHPEHKWFIDFCDGILLFRKKPLVNSGSPIFGVYPLIGYLIDDEVKLMMEYYYRNVSCVQLLWKNEFYYKVVD